MKVKIEDSNRILTIHSEVVIEFYFNWSMAEKAKGRELFDLLEKHDLFPSSYCLFPDNRRLKIEHNELESFLDARWLIYREWNIHLKEIITRFKSFTLNRTKKPKYWGRLCRGWEHYPFHNAFHLSIQIDKIKSFEPFEGYINDFLDRYKVDFGRVQFYSEEEVLSSMKNRQPDSTLVSRELQEKCIPYLYNMTIWGKPYIELFGREKLMNTDCYKVEELKSGAIKMQLSPHLFDERGCWSALKEERERVQKYIDNDVFFDPTLPQPYDHKYNTPVFDLSEITKPITPEEWERMKEE